MQITHAARAPCCQARWIRVKCDLKRPRTYLLLVAGGSLPAERWPSCVVLTALARNRAGEPQRKVAQIAARQQLVVCLLLELTFARPSCAGGDHRSRGIEFELRIKPSSTCKPIQASIIIRRGGKNCTTASGDMAAVSQPWARPPLTRRAVGRGRGVAHRSGTGRAFIAPGERTNKRKLDIQLLDTTLAMLSST